MVDEPVSSPVQLLSRPEATPTTRVALLRPPCVVLLNALAGGGPMPPIGLAYIAAALRVDGHEVQAIDAPGEALTQYEDIQTAVGHLRRIGLTPAEVVERIEPGTTVIGITHMFLHEWPVVRELAEAAKARFPDAVVVIGGENATAFWPWMFEQTEAIDCVVLGEGEATMNELVARVAQGLPYHEMQGLAVRVTPEGVSADNGLPVRLRKLGEVARPAWDLFPLDNYFEQRSFFGVDRGRAMPLLATRGCPYKCSFCSSPRMWTTRYIVRDPDDLADEIASYVEQYGIVNVDFVDLTAMTKRQWTLDFCDALDRRKLDITWQIPIGTRSEGIDAVVLKRLWETGCRNITFAPESGSQHMLEVFDKRLDLDHIIMDIREAAKLGLVAHVNTIIGHPAETWRDRWDNLTFLVRAALAGAETGSAAMFHPYPGSRDFQDLYDAGKIKVDDGFYYDGLAKTSSTTHCWNDGLSSRQLYLTQLVMLAACYGVGLLRRPKRILNLVKVMFGGSEHNFVEQQVRARLKRGPLSARKPARVPKARRSGDLAA